METGAVTVERIELDEAKQLAQWDSWVQAHPDGTCFFRSAWIEGIAHDLRQPVELLLVFEGEKLMGGTAVAPFGRLGFWGVRRPFATPYNYPILAAGISVDVRRRLLDALRRHLRMHYGMVQWTHSPFSPEPGRDEILACDHCRPKLTSLLDITDRPVLWRGFQSELRNRIRRASNHGVLVTEARDALNFAKLYTTMFSSIGKTVPFSHFQMAAFCNRLHEANQAKLFEARDAIGRLHVAALITLDPQRAYYTFSASDPGLRASGANSLLLWEIFERLGREGVASFDVVGLNLPSITRFKRRFRGIELPYNETTWFATRWQRWAWAWYGKVRGLPTAVPAEKSVRL